MTHADTQSPQQSGESSPSTANRLQQIQTALLKITPTDKPETQKRYQWVFWTVGVVVVLLLVFTQNVVLTLAVESALLALITISVMLRPRGDSNPFADAQKLIAVAGSNPKDYDAVKLVYELDQPSLIESTSEKGLAPAAPLFLLLLIATFPQFLPNVGTLPIPGAKDIGEFIRACNLDQGIISTLCLIAAGGVWYVWSEGWLIRTGRAYRKQVLAAAQAILNQPDHTPTQASQPT